MFDWRQFSEDTAEEKLTEMRGGPLSKDTTVAKITELGKSNQNQRYHRGFVRHVLTVQMVRLKKITEGMRRETTIIEISPRQN